MKIAVSTMPTNPGPAAWNELLGPAATYPPLETDLTVDFAIIGAGFAGLAAARRLKQLNPKAKIAVLDADKIAHGPAGRNSGFMIDIPHKLDSHDYAGSRAGDLVKLAMNREAIAFSQDAFDEYDMPAEALVMSGKINAAATPRGVVNNQNYARHLNSLGEEYEILDARRMQKISGSDYYQQGLFTPGTALVQPALYIRSLAQGLSDQGVLIFESTPVTNLSRSEDSWAVQTPRAGISAGKVILATNGHVESFGFFKQRLMHIYLYASITRKLSPDECAQLGGQPNWGFTPADPLGTTVRRISGMGGDRIIIRNRFTWAAGRTAADNKLNAIAPIHDRSFKARFPNLPAVQMEHRWGGLLCLSRNGVPAFGELEPGLYSACCQNGLGTVMGTLSGKLAAELASESTGGETTQTLQNMLAFEKPEKLPPKLLASIGANAYMRWSEFRAGREL